MCDALYPDIQALCATTYNEQKLTIKGGSVGDHRQSDQKKGISYNNTKLLLPEKMLAEVPGWGLPVSPRELARISSLCQEGDAASVSVRAKTVLSVYVLWRKNKTSITAKCLKEVSSPWQHWSPELDWTLLWWRYRLVSATRRHRR